MGQRPEGRLVVRTAWLTDPGVWIWEIAESTGEQVIDSCWAAGWVGYDTEEAAEHAGRGRLVGMRAGAGGGPGGGANGSSVGVASITVGHRTPRGRLIVVPRSRAALYRALKRSFCDDANVEVVLDRRFRQRRVQGAHHEPDRRGSDRRRRADVDAQLAAGRSVTIPTTAPRTRPFDADGRAILVLFCSEHVIGCGACGMTHRMRWLRRNERWAFSCPGCDADVTLDVVRHTQACAYWRGRATPTDRRLPTHTQATA